MEEAISGLHIGDDLEATAGSTGGRDCFGGPIPSLAPHRIVTGGVDDVHCSHVLIQEVTADGNRVATTAVVFLDGDTRGESGSCRAKTAPGTGWQRAQG